jgi:hypothetical protein
MILNLREAYARAPAVSVFTTDSPGVNDIGWVPDPIHDGDPDRRPELDEGADEDLPVRPVWWMKPPETRRQCVATNAGEKPSAEALKCAYKVNATYTPRAKRAPLNNGMRMAGGLGRRRRQEESMMRFARGGRGTDTLASEVEMGEVDASPAVVAAAEEKRKGKRPSVAVRSFGSVVSDVGSVVFGTGSRTLAFARTVREPEPEPETPTSAAPLIGRSPLMVQTDAHPEALVPPPSGRMLKKSEETLLGSPLTPRWDRIQERVRSDSRASAESESSSSAGASGSTSGSVDDRGGGSGRRGPPGTFSF